MDKTKRLKYISDELLKKQAQADALRDLAERNPEAASAIDNILAAFGIPEDIHKVQDTIDKFNSVVSLIKINIKNSKGYKNFPESEYVDDKKQVFDIKHKSLSINKISNQDMSLVNKIYKKHLNIQSILQGK